MVYNDSQGKPLRAAFHRLPRELHFVQSLTSHIFRQRVRPPWVYVCLLGFMTLNLVIHLEEPCTAPARDDHSSPQVWWSLPCSRHPKPSPHLLPSCPPASFCTMLPQDAVMCSITQSHGLRPHFLPGLFSLTLEL